MSSKLFPTYLIFTFLFSLLPFFLLNQYTVIRDDYRYIAFYIFFYLISWLICIKTPYKRKEQNVRRNGSLSSEDEEKAKYNEIGGNLKIVLILIFFQNLLICYLLFSNIHFYFLYMTARPIIIIIGCISVYYTCQIYEKSNAYFHTSDVLEPYLLVLILGSAGYLAWCGVTIQQAIMLCYVPFYVYILKGIILITWFPSGMHDIRNEGVVTCLTLTGKRYRGTPDAYYFSILGLDEVQESSDGENWQEGDYVWLLPFYVIWMTKEED